MALLAPMPSASVIAAISVKRRRGSQLPDRERHVVSEFFEPLRQSHLAISLSSKVNARPFQPIRASPSRAMHHLASSLRVQPLVDQLARPHVDVEGDLFVHLLGDVHTP